MLANRRNQRKDCLATLMTKNRKNHQFQFLNNQKVKRGCSETLMKSKNLKNNQFLQKLRQSQHKTRRDYSQVPMMKMICSQRKQRKSHNLSNLNKHQCKVNQSFKQKNHKASLQVHWCLHKNPYRQAPW